MVMGVVAIYWEKEYDGNGKLNILYEKMHCCDNDTILASHHYFYRKDGVFSHRTTKSYKDGQVTTTEENDYDPFSQNLEEKYKSIKNEHGQIVGGLAYPCGIIYEGENKRWLALK